MVYSSPSFVVKGTITEGKSLRLGAGVVCGISMSVPRIVRASRSNLSRAPQDGVRLILQKIV